MIAFILVVVLMGLLLMSWIGLEAIVVFTSLYFMNMVKLKFLKACIFMAIQSLGLYGSIIPNTLFVKTLNIIEDRLSYGKKNP